VTRTAESLTRPRREGPRFGRAARNRAIVLALLACFIAGVYVLIVFGLGWALGTDVPNTGLSVVAMTVVALSFARARRGAERLANRITYGERATPYEVLSGVSEQAARADRPQEALPMLARLIARGTGAARVDVWIRAGAELLAAAVWPHEAVRRVASVPLPMDESLAALPGADRAVAVRDRGELLGAIAISKRQNEPPTAAEEKLLDDVASQAGLVLRNVRLTAELEARLDELQAREAELRSSRQRIVEAQDAERRRLERDIHDGAQQHLVALAVKLRMAKTMAERDPKRAGALVTDVRKLADSALANLGDLTRGIYPPALVEQGVAAALREHARKAGMRVTVTAKGTRRAEPAAEAAAYFCCLEALQNATKHAPSSRVRVSIERSVAELVFSVADDGPGFDLASAVRASGLQNMEDRVAVLGGTLDIRSTPGVGTTVEGRIPLRPEKAS
jgi:signal transduction histidine kinase